MSTRYSEDIRHICLFQYFVGLDHSYTDPSISFDERPMKVSRGHQRSQTLFLSVTCDEKIETWVGLIETHQLTMVHWTNSGHHMTLT